MITAVLPSYKNKELLIRNLKHNLPFLKSCQIVIVNDDPSESIKKDLAEFKITLVENKTNLGFSGAVNQGVKKAEHNYIMFLNSDVVLFDSSYEKAVKHFKEDEKLFAVSFAQKERDGSIVGRNKLFFQKGFMYHTGVDAFTQTPEVGSTAWAEGGASMVRKDLFEKLGGFDECFKPFYWEDIDLSYRAVKRGFRIFFDNTIVVDHFHESTIKTYFKSDTIETIAFRNQFLFMWKNLTFFQLVKHFFFLPYHFAYFILKGKWTFIRGFMNAVKYKL